MEAGQLIAYEVGKGTLLLLKRECEYMSGQEILWVLLIVSSFEITQ